jgi:O-antigen/teichoic acid export membrane protein
MSLWAGSVAGPWRPEAHNLLGASVRRAETLTQRRMNRAIRVSWASHRVRDGAHGTYRRGFAFGMLSFLFMACIGVLSTIATARIYGVRIVGQFALVSAPVGALWVLSTVKEQPALIRAITGLPPRDPRVTELWAAVFTFSSALTAALSVVGGLACSLIFRGPLHHPALVAPMLVSLAGYAVVTNTGWNVDSIFCAFVAGRQLFWVRLHEAVSFFVIAIAIGIAWHSVWGLVIATIGGSLSALAHRVLAARPFLRLRLEPGGYGRGIRALPGLLRFGLKIAPGGLAQGISGQAGIWAVASVAPTALVGAYSRAQTVPDRLQQVNYRIVEVLFPTLVGRRARGDHLGFDRALLDTVRYGLIGMLLLAAVCGGAAHSILSLFGPGFSRASAALAILMVYPALAVIASAQQQALLAVNRPGLTSIIATTRLIATVSLTVLLTPSVGIVGPPIALMCGLLLEISWKTAVLLPVLSRPLQESWPRSQRVWLIAAYACAFEATHGIARSGSSLAWLVVSLVVGALIYIAVLLVGKAINERDRERLADAVALVRRWRAGRQPLEAAPT